MFAHSRAFFSKAIRVLAWTAAAVVACIGTSYALAYLFGAIFAAADGRIVAAYPAALEAKLSVEHGTYLPYSAVPRCAIDGTVSVEDKRFFYSPGFDPIAIVRVALFSLWNDKRDYGGSTITQQLARMIIGEPRKHPSLLAEIWSELRVIKYGLIVEHDFPKDKILELYLNGVYYGRGAEGFAQAAEAYFGTDAAHLSQSECYYLTGLPQAPSYYGSNTRAAAGRYQHVLSTLRRNGYLTNTEEKALASSTPATAITARRNKASQRPSLAATYSQRSRSAPSGAPLTAPSGSYMLP